MIGERLLVIAGALILDANIGDPDRLWRRIGHPVAWIGAVIARLDQALNRAGDPNGRRRLLGSAALAVVTAGAFAVGVVLEVAAATMPYGWMLEVAVASVFLAGRSLFDHVRAVSTAFPDLAAARAAVARIVGRDTAQLDGPAVCRSAIESTAENLSDGVVAPALWFVLFGLPGLLAYKAINTADSMIGHRTPRHEAFGWAAARLDDIVNWPAARLTGVLVALAAPLARGSIATAFRIMARDGDKHRSPNAGWPEAAMAGALGVALSGPRSYGGTPSDDPFLNAEGRVEATPKDIGNALKVAIGGWAILVAAIVAGAAWLW